MTRGVRFSTSQEFYVEECCNCGISFAMTAELYRRCKDNPGPRGRSFYCPNGHNQHYVGESETDQQRRRADRLAQQIAQRDDRIIDLIDQRDAADRRTAAAKGRITKLKKRAAAGVCPCCSRSFENLKRHMATKHPNFVADEPESNVVPLKANGAA